MQHFGHQYHPLTQTNNLLVTINSSVNFIIYCIFGHKFKRIFITLICGAMSRGRNTQGTHTMIDYEKEVINIRLFANFSWKNFLKFILILSGGLLRFHSQYKMSHQNSNVCLQMKSVQQTNGCVSDCR